MNTTCSQCGAVLPKGAPTCIFCESSETPLFHEGSSATRDTLALKVSREIEWRGELNQRVQAYRQRRRKTPESDGQAQLPFIHRESNPPARAAVEVAEHSVSDERQPARNDDFAFTIAIGRTARQKESFDTQYLIDVSTPAEKSEEGSTTFGAEALPEREGMYPVATLDDRRSAALIDAACLAFAFGGFLALFGSLGGHFTFSKLNAAVYFFTFAFVYLQYFGLFTIFGGTTPGMMIRGLQVATFTGGEPTLRHLLLRATGYVLSAGTLFLGFLWALWDEDALTWHDRLSGTYLRIPEALTEMEASHPAPSR